MTDGPIQLEIRAARRKLLADCNGDLETLFRQLRAQSAQHPERMVTLEDVRRVSAESERQPLPALPAVGSATVES